MEHPQGIDAHAHVFSATAAAVAGARYRPAYEATLEAWRSHWPAAGISHGVLVQPSFFGTDNSEMLAAIARDPLHLRGVAVIDESFGDGALRRLHDGGVRALRLNLHGEVDLDGFASIPWRAVFARVHDLGWHLEVFVDAGCVPAIASALARLPLPVVLDHFGVPGRGADATFAAARTLAATRPVWCKLSAPYRLEGGDGEALATRWIEALGVERLVWGSDWPWTRHEKERDYLRLRRDLDRWVGAEHARRILWDNAARLYRFS